MENVSNYTSGKYYKVRANGLAERNHYWVAFRTDVIYNVLKEQGKEEKILLEDM